MYTVGDTADQDMETSNTINVVLATGKQFDSIIVDTDTQDAPDLNQQDEPE